MRALIPVIALILLLSISFSQYYADVSINIDKSGLVSISGLTNSPELTVKSTNNFTSKQGNNWILNITINEKFSNYVYSVSLPRNAAINYIKAPQGFRIEQGIQGLIIKGAAENQKFQIIVQYQLIEDIYTGYFVVAVLLLLASVTAFFVFKSRPKKQKKKINLEDFPERQKKILEIIIKNKRTTLTELLKHLNLPKSSLSRNIDSLVKQGVITSERKGMSKIIKLKE